MVPWNSWFLLMVGGALGTCGRFLLSKTVAGLLGVGFPYGTLAVNLVGCLLAGLVLALSEESSAWTPKLHLFVMVGFLGGLTTFSAYEAESFLLIKKGLMGRALLNLGGSLVLGLFALWIGYEATRWILGNGRAH